MCYDAGFMWGSVCPTIRAGCMGPRDLYQELYSIKGQVVYCCRCILRGTAPSGLPPFAEACPQDWTDIQPGDNSFAWACSAAHGILSEGFTPKHCAHCEAVEGPPTGQRRRLLDVIYNVELFSRFQRRRWDLFPLAQPPGARMQMMPLWMVPTARCGRKQS